MTTLRRSSVVLVAVLVLLVGASVSAGLADGSPGLPNPRAAVLNGLPVSPEPLAQGLVPEVGVFPLKPLDRDATEGLRHGYVQTSSGRFGFGITDMTLPARVPFRVGRIYDAGLLAMLPGVPTYEPRTSMDMGANWMFEPTSMMIPFTGGTFLLLTDEGSVVQYFSAGAGQYKPGPDRPSRFGPMVSDGQGGYKVTLTNGLVRSYKTVPGSTNFWLVKESDASGNYLSFNYRDGFLETIVASDGASIKIKRPMWGAPGGAYPNTRIVEVDEMLGAVVGRVVHFEYTDDGQLSAATDVSGERWTYLWDSAKHIVYVKEPNGQNAFTIATDSQSRATSVQFDHGTTLYNYQSTKTVVTAPDPGQWTYDKDSRGTTTRVTAPDGGITAITRDATTADITRIVDAEGGQHDFEHDTGHRLTRYLAPTVDGVRPEWRYTFDASGRLTRMTPAAGGITVLAYDATGRLVSRSVDSNGDGTAETAESYQRATNGDVTALTDGAGRRTEYQYQADDTLVDLHGNVAQVKPPCLLGGTVCPVIKLRYDSAGRLSSLKWPTGPGTWSQWQTTYSAGGVVTSIIDPESRTWIIAPGPMNSVGSITAPGGAVTQFTWRTDGQLATIVDALGHTSRWTYDDSGNPVKFTDANSADWTFGWDAEGRLAWRKDPDNRMWSYQRDRLGRVTAATLPGGRSTQYVWDPSSRLRQRLLYGGDAETFTWDRAGRMASAEQHVTYAGQTVIDHWDYTWDGRGLITSVHQSSGGAVPISKTLTWTWDASGKLASYTDAADATWTVSRDEWGRPVSITSNSAIGESTQAFDPWSGWLVSRTHREGGLGEAYTYTPSGLLARVTETEGSLTSRDVEFTHDARGLVNGVIDHHASPATTTTYSLDLVGRITGVHYPDGSSEGYALSPRGERIARVKTPVDGAPSTSEAYYDASGHPLRVVGPNYAVGWEWNFNPSDAEGSSAIVTRTAYAPQQPQTRMSFDADGRIRRVERLNGTVWEDARRMRWFAGGAPWQVAGDVVSGATATTSYMLGISGPVSAFTGAGTPSWLMPVLDVQGRLDDGAWRGLAGGRLFSTPDEAPHARMALRGLSDPLPQELGGGTVDPQFALPNPMAMASDLAPLRFASIEDERVAGQSMDPQFRDASEGLPVDGATIALPAPSVILLGTVGNPLGNNIRSGAGPTFETLFPGEDLCQQSDHAGPGCPPLAHYPDPSWEAPPEPHPTLYEPMQNPDTHPLGVDLGTGLLKFTVEDLRIPGRGLDLALRRTYRSGGGGWDGGEGRLGTGWWLELFDEGISREGQWDNYSGDYYSWRAPDGARRPLTANSTVDNAPIGFSDFARFAVTSGPVHWPDALDLMTYDGVIRRFHNGRLERLWVMGGSRIDIIYEVQSPSRPTDAVLYSCDSDPQTNPSFSWCQPVELGRLHLEYIGEPDAAGILTSRLKKVTATVSRSGGTSPRSVTYGYSTMRPSPPSWGGEYMTDVTASCGSCGEPAVKVAQYEYSGQHPQAGKDCGWMQYFNIIWIQDAEHITTAFSYRPYDYVPRHFPLVQKAFVAPTQGLDYTCGKVNDAAAVSAAQTTTFEYSGETASTQHTGVTITTGDRVSTHVMSLVGQRSAGTITRADGSKQHYEFDDFGRMTKSWLTTTVNNADVPLGPEHRWAYEALRNEIPRVALAHGTRFPHPVEERVVPASTTHGELTEVTCYVLDAVTGEPWRTMHVSVADPSDTTACQSLSNSVLPSTAEETVRGWMLACPQGDPRDGVTTDYKLKEFLRKFGILPWFGQPALPFKCSSSDATRPWAAVQDEIGRAPMKALNSAGQWDLLSAADRPHTTYFYSDRENLKKIQRADGSSVLLTYLDPDDATPGVAKAGSVNGTGALAQVEVTGSARVSLTRFVYDAWRNMSEQHRLIDGTETSGRWLKLKTTYDMRNRVTAQSRESGDGTLSTSLGFRYTAAGRLKQKRVETTRDVRSPASRTYALLEYTYTNAGLLESEKSFATSTGDPWVGSGASTERRLAYDGLGNVIQEATRLRTTPATAWRIVRFAWDKFGRKVRTDAFESEFASAAPPDAGTSLSGRRTISRVWFDSLGGAPWEQIQGFDGSTVTIARTVQRDYDGQHRVQGEKSCLDAQAGTDSTYPTCGRTLNASEVTYDGESRIIDQKVTGEPRGVQGSNALMGWVKTEFDQRGRVIVKQVAASTTEVVPTDCGSGPACRWLETRTGYDLGDRVAREASPTATGGWSVTQTAWDANGRRTRITDPLLNYVDIGRNFLGQAQSKTIHENPGAQTLADVLTNFRYDGLGRLNGVKLPTPSAGGAERWVQRNLDARDNAVEEWSPLAGTGTLGDAYKSEFTFDGLGRKTMERRHIGTANTWTDGWQDVSYSYDDGGRLTAIIAEPNATTAGVKDQRTDFEYDAQGRRTRRLLPDERSSGASDPDRREEVTTYDSAGRLYTTQWLGRPSQTCGGFRCSYTIARSQDAASRVTSLDIDATHVVAAHYAGTGASRQRPDQTWTYDGLGRVIQSTDKNGFPDATDDVTATTWFDSLGRVYKEQVGAWAVQHTFDGAGRPATTTYPVAATGRTSSTTVGWSWDDLGRLIDLADTQATGSVAHWSYSGASRLVQSTRADGSQWAAPTNSWDGAARRTEGKVSNGASTVFFDEHMVYNDNDEVLRVEWSHVTRGDNLAEVQTYQYDETGRLTSFREGGFNGTSVLSGAERRSRDWTLDELGSWRTHKDTDSPLVSPSVNKINGYDSWPERASSTTTNIITDEVRGFIYERELGNGDKVEYVHDLLGRLVAVKKAMVENLIETTETLVSYGYDASGRLAWRREPGREVWFVYSGGKTVQEISGGAVLWEYTWAGDRLVSARDQNGVVYQAHQDRLGSVVLATRIVSGTLQADQKAAYDPYGRPVAIPETGASGMSIPFGFAGARFEDRAAIDRDLTGRGVEKLGLYLMGARWYDPELGRFIEQDPIGESGGLNVYAYVGSRPTLMVDPSGLSASGVGFGMAIPTTGQLSYSAMQGARHAMLALPDAGGVGGSSAYDVTRPLLHFSYNSWGGDHSDTRNPTNAEKKLDNDQSRVSNQGKLGEDTATTEESKGSSGSTNKPNGADVDSCDPAKWTPPNVVVRAKDGEFTQKDAERYVCEAFRAADGNIAAAQEVERVRELPGTVFVDVTTIAGGGTSSHAGLTSFIVEWDPTAGLLTRAGGIESPAVGLFHELYHVTNSYDNEVTTQWANTVAAWWGQPPRANYSDSSRVTVFGPTSTTPVPW